MHTDTLKSTRAIGTSAKELVQNRRKLCARPITFLSGVLAIRAVFGETRLRGNPVAIAAAYGAAISTRINLSVLQGALVAGDLLDHAVAYDNNAFCRSCLASQ